jgi:hypothetical protein
MNYLRWALLFVVFTAVGFLGNSGVWGQTTPTPQKASAPLTLYTNSVEQVSFLVPSPWNFKELNQKGEGYFLCAGESRPLKDPTEPFAESLNLVVSDLPSTLTPAQFLDDYTKNLTTSLKELKVEKKGEVSGANTLGKYLIYSHQHPSVAPRVKSLVFLFVNKDKGYALSCTSTAVNYPSYEEIFRSIGKSFKFN